MGGGGSGEGGWGWGGGGGRGVGRSERAQEQHAQLAPAHVRGVHEQRETDSSLRVGSLTSGGICREERKASMSSWLSVESFCVRA